MSEGHDNGAYECKREREAKGSSRAKRDDLDPEAVFPHHKPPDSDARTSAVAIEMPDRRRPEAVQKADFVEWANGPARLPPARTWKKVLGCDPWEPLKLRQIAPD